jgi:hypothetical protein
MGGLVTQVRRVAAILAAALVLCAGCKVDARVDVTLRADGSGTVTARVTLDADAVSRLTTHAPLAQAVPLDDVRAAGWNVSGWKRSAGGATLTLSHAFVGQADLARRLTDLVGSTGVLRDPHITRTRGWFDAKDTISVTGDLRHLSTGVKADAALAKNLAAAGVDVDALAKQLQSELDRSFSLTLAVHAPDGQTKTVQLRSGDHASIAATSSRRQTTRVVLVIVGVGLLALALLVTAGSLVATRRRRRASSTSRGRGGRSPASTS